MSLRRGGRDAENRGSSSAEISTMSISQRIELRAGDDLPGFAAIVEDETGTAVDLTGATCWLIICDERDGEPIENTQIHVIDADSGVVQHDWTGQMTGDEWGPGHYQVWVVAEWADGRRITAPSERDLELVIGPGVHIA